MTKMRRICYFALCALLAGVPITAEASGSTLPMLTLRQVENRYPASKREGVGRALIAGVIAPGMEISLARQRLRSHGMKCDQGSAVHCTYTTKDSPENYLKNIVWSVDISGSDGAVQSYDIKRSIVDNW